MAGFKTFANNELLTAANLNDLLMRQVAAQVTSQAERDAIPLPTDGMTVFRLDTKKLERYNSTAGPGGAGVWRVLGCHARMKRSATALNLNNTTWNQHLSLNTYWTEDFRDAGIAAFSNGWTIPWAGLWRVEFGAIFAGAADIGVTVNKATATGGFNDLSAFAQGPNGASAVGMPAGEKLLRLAAGDILRLFGAAVPASIAWRTEAASSWFGIRYEGD